MTALPGQVGHYAAIEDEDVDGTEAWAVKTASGTERMTADQVAARVAQIIYPSGDTTGVTDTAALQAAMTAGGSYVLLPESRGFYYLKARAYALSVTAQITAPFGVARVHMLTGAGNFDHASQLANLWASNQVGFLFELCTKPRIENVRFTFETQSAARTCSAVQFAGCTDGFCDVIVESIAEAWGGAVGVNSCTRGEFRVLANGCGANTATLPALQVSAMEVDNHRLSSLSSVNTKGAHFWVRYKDFKLGNVALAQYGPQTDALNIAGLGYSGCTFDVNGDGVGEALDLWADDCRGEVNAINTQGQAVKLINGASGNTVVANINATGLAAVYMSDATQQAGSNNLVLIDARNIGSLNAAVVAVYLAMSAPEPGVYIQDHALTYEPTKNTFIGRVQGVSPTVIPYIARNTTTGAGNRFLLDGANATSVGDETPIATTVSPTFTGTLTAPDIRTTGASGQFYVKSRTTARDWQVYSEATNLQVRSSNANAVVAEIGDGGTLLLGAVTPTQVLANRKTGWTVSTGTAARTAFDTATVTTEELAKRVKALIDDLHNTAGHGLIGT